MTTKNLLILKELIIAYEEAYSKNDWTIIQNALDDWKATVEVESNPKLVKLLKAKGDPSKYIEAH